ncbi:hypothetical protein [Magnetospirillum molischianum]|uniref:Uncharacterized protein n=1 Tax=Magnetospirillum molischianum DSM 120 TaxID=1150626 RepID=H8FQS9_MAGML|nr:hypothetical protein [Magnetospirillum molischianum]CCG40717.1 conserved hypothetical protein [Magnetospirillum molischianum DSM 120]
MRDTVEPPAPVKHSYTVPCPSVFRDRVEALAARRRVNVADIARSILLVLPVEAIATFPDPGEPPMHDRETVVLKSGPAEGRPWRRKPRLQIRMAPGFDIETIRRALGLALALDDGGLALRIDDPAAAPPPPPPVAEPAGETFPKVERRRGVNEQSKALAAATEEIERLKAIINVLSFEVLPSGVQTREQALHILGFPPRSQSRPSDGEGKVSDAGDHPSSR